MLQHNQTILVIEDDDDIRTIVRYLFTDRGYRVIEATDGLRAVARARQHLPALIVLDLGLPGQDGWAVARELRADPAFDHTPIVVMTAYGSLVVRQTAQAVGCQAIVAKPFTMAALAEVAESLLAQRYERLSIPSPMHHQERFGLPALP